MICIIGRGNFGSALKKLFETYQPSWPVLSLDKMADRDAIGDIEAIRDAKVVIPAVPIVHFETVLREIVPYLSPDAIVIDVCTIKAHTTALMREILPASNPLISCHPLFGPESLSAANWRLNRLNLVIWPERIAQATYQSILTGLRKTGLNVIELSPLAHDQVLAKSQFLSLLIGSMLVRMDVQSTEMNTRSFDELLDVKDTTRNDFNILKDVFRFNPECEAVLETFEKTLGQISTELRESGSGNNALDTTL